MQCFYFICEFYPHTHVKITRQWKSTLRLATCIVKLVIIKDYWSGLVMSFKISKPFLSKRYWKSSSWTLRLSTGSNYRCVWKSSFPLKWATCKRMQQLPTLLRQQCWELLRACWQWCANGCNNSQQVWDLQCIVGRIQLISQQRWKSCQTDPTLLRYASAITEQKKCWELLAEKFDRFQTLRNNSQSTTCNRVCKRSQRATSNNIGSCWHWTKKNVTNF